MVPPPSAVMQLSMHTPTQSMLRRPAASAAVMACAAIATSDSPCSTKSLAGRLHIDSLRVGPPRNLGRRFHHEQGAMNAEGSPEHPWLLEVVFRQDGGTRS